MAAAAKKFNGYNVGITRPLSGDVVELFKEKGYRTFIISRLEDFSVAPLHIMCFTGGEDISSSLYNEPTEPRTHSNPARDTLEVDLFHASSYSLKVGICRGAQLIHALTGGKLRQHIEGHSGGHHTVEHHLGKDTLVNSIHHQGIIPNNRVNKDYFAYSKEENPIVEGFFDGRTKSYCVQYHPEWGDEGCREFFWNGLGKFLGAPA